MKGLATVIIDGENWDYLTRNTHPNDVLDWIGRVAPGYGTNPRPRLYMPTGWLRVPKIYQDASEALELTPERTHRKKDALDVRVNEAILELAHPHRTLFLFSGDGYYIRAIEHTIDVWKQVVVVGKRNNINQVYFCHPKIDVCLIEKLGPPKKGAHS